MARLGLAPYLKRVKRDDWFEYYYLMPNGQYENVGRYEDEAIEIANSLTVILRKDGRIIKRILGIDRDHFIEKDNRCLFTFVADEFVNQVLTADFLQMNTAKSTYLNKLKTVDFYRYELRHKNCDQVTTFDLAKLLKSRTGHAQRKHIPLLKRLFRFAISQGYLQINPANELEPKLLEVKKRRRHTWEGLQEVKACCPSWLQRAIDIALYSLQRRGDLVSLKIETQINKKNRSILILQEKTRNYKKPVYIEIIAGDSLWQAINSCLLSGLICPFLLSCKPDRVTRQALDGKDHIFAVTPDYLTKQFKKYRDQSGAYKYLKVDERPTFHDIRALGILFYYKAGYSLDYIMTLAGHAREDTTKLYISGHEKIVPVIANAELSLSSVDISSINWDLDLPNGFDDLLNF